MIRLLIDENFNHSGIPNEAFYEVGVGKVVKEGWKVVGITA